MLQALQKCDRCVRHALIRKERLLCGKRDSRGAEFLEDFSSKVKSEVLPLQASR